MRSTCSGVMMPALLLDPRHSKAEGELEVHLPR